MPDQDARNVWTFRFILSAALAPLLAQGAPLSVSADAVELAFSPEVEAQRSAMGGDPEMVRDVASKLRDGFVLTSNGDLMAPFAQRGAGLAAILDQYEHCDRLTHEIIGRRLHVVGGTLLGAARQSGPIDHDVDFDASYLSAARDAASLKVEYMAFLGELLRRGENVRLVNQLGHVRRRHFKWRSNARWRPGAATVEIDVLPAFIDREDFYCRPTFVRIPGGEDLILPLRRAPFEDREVWAPNRMTEKAEQVFGPGWRTPDPFWVKPSFLGVADALSDLKLSDEDLLALADAMPAAQSNRLRAALAAKPAAAKRSIPAKYDARLLET
ncbi:hypothetical protein IHQ68_15500 [Chelatococcus sambhunathii]|uniref:Nucleotidyl transferase AbiEii toxin, Type IV TA system n=1 Tax=Chelatococcus sambhunathii TaxID=363953 RepID=A0ABU1DIT2_9HYPH|nr:hypothetical protein [Chelatococcus sambhunathii]MDR4308027.1 hypothetical protein [Chelatococcus sambhunathii]